MLKKIN